MLIGCLLVVFGLLLFLVNPLLGIIPRVLLIAAGVAFMLFGGIFRGVSAVTGGGNKTCPQCKSKVPRSATVCRYCNLPVWMRRGQSHVADDR
jgi:hypothetical protein